MKNDKSKERGDRRALFEYEWHYSAPAARAASRQAPLNRYRKGFPGLGRAGAARGIEFLAE